MTRQAEALTKRGFTGILPAVPEYYWNPTAGTGFVLAAGNLDENTGNITGIVPARQKFTALTTGVVLPTGILPSRLLDQYRPPVFTGGIPESYRRPVLRPVIPADYRNPTGGQYVVQ